MRRAIEETERRRKKQMDYNRVNRITPRSVVKPVRNLIEATVAAEEGTDYGPEKLVGLEPAQRKKMIGKLKKEMELAARDLEFEKAAELRDLIFELEQSPASGSKAGKRVSGFK